MAEENANEQLGEDPEVLAEQAKATQDLADFLKFHGIEIDYWEADWKDSQGLAEGVRKLCLEHPGWSMYYFSGDTWGIDSNYVFFTSKEVEGEVAEKIGEYIVGFGAELPEKVAPPRPKCPKCGEEIDAIDVVYSATVAGWIEAGDKDHTVQFPESRLKPWDIIDEDTAVYECPHCSEELFKAGEEAEMIAFLKKGEGS